MTDFYNSSVCEQASHLSPESADGTLVIIVCRAKHLPNRRKLDKQSPYVTLRIGTTARKTPAHFRAGQTPEWTHEVRFQLNRDRKPMMILDVLDETKNEPTPIGNTEIDCSVIFSNPDNHQEGKYIYDKWYDLTLNGRRAGTIYLEMTFYPSAPVVPPKISEPYLVEAETDFYENIRSHPSSPEYPYNPRRSLSRSTSPNKELPLPPKHPSQARPKNVADEIFVSSVDSDKSALSKRLSFFKNSQSSTNTTPFGSSSESYDDIGVVERSEDTATNSSSKFTSKLNKLKYKFQAKEAISTLWHHNSSNISIGQHEYPSKRSSSPINDYDLDQLEKDIFKNKLYKLPDNNNHQRQRIMESDDEVEIEFRPPVPPPHLINSPEENDIIINSPSVPSKANKIKSPTRKPPPSSIGDMTDSFKNLNIKQTSSVPFSADTIGMEPEEEDLPTKVYLLDQPVKSLNPSKFNDNGVPYKLNPDEIDPKYYAPTPTEHLAKTLRLQNGNITKKDLAIDLRTKETGYLGDGKFSPSIFDKVNSDITPSNKPNVPPKIPKGLTEMEYYVLEKEKYLKDINGRRL